MSGHIFTEIFQDQMFKVKIWHFFKPCHHFFFKDIEFSYKLMHGINITNYISPNLKLYHRYCHNWTHPYLHSTNVGVGVWAPQSTYWHRRSFVQLQKLAHFHQKIREIPNFLYNCSLLETVVAAEIKLVAIRTCPKEYKLWIS